MKGQY